MYVDGCQFERVLIIGYEFFCTKIVVLSLSVIALHFLADILPDSSYYKGDLGTACPGGQLSRDGSGVGEDLRSLLVLGCPRRFGRPGLPRLRNALARGRLHCAVLHYTASGGGRVFFFA